MSILSIMFIGVGLSMDAFAVAVTNGICMGRLRIKTTIKIAAFFGFFQAIMPIIGWAAGSSFKVYIMRIDHWIAFILLSAIGGKMIFESLKSKDNIEKAKCIIISNKELFVLAIATSIDALAVGVSFAFLNVAIFKAASIIGIITFAISFAGVIIGNKFGSIFKKKAEIIGGAILIIIGIKILTEHIMH